MNDISRPSATSPEKPSAFREPLPDAWIVRLFGRLLALYGSQFADKWAGTDPANVRATWAEKLAGFRDQPEAIAAALEDCDSRPTPPNLPEFLTLCREAAKRIGSRRPALPHIPTAEEIDRAREAANRAAKAVDRSSGFDYLAWARNPGTDIAMRAVVECAERKDPRFVEILADLKARGVCDEDGKLRRRAA